MSEIETDIEQVVDAEPVVEAEPAAEAAPAPEGEAVDYVPFEATVTGEQPVAGDLAGDLERLHDVPVELAVEIGRTRMTIGETLALGPGSIITLNRLAGEPVDLLVNGKPIARGEVVVIDEEFGLRVTEVVTGGRAKSVPDAD
jgi:flagellar motor switch protein FliN/FliY